MQADFNFAFRLAYMMSIVALLIDGLFYFCSWLPFRRQIVPTISTLQVKWRNRLP